MIPTSIDGTDITGATIDGTDVTEITVDGQTVFTAETLPVAYSNLVAWYPFDSATYGGSNADDVTAIIGGSGDDTAYDGTVNGATYQSSGGVTDIRAGANSGAFEFTGGVGGDRIALDVTGINESTFTICFFVNVDLNNGGYFYDSDQNDRYYFYWRDPDTLGSTFGGVINISLNDFNAVGNYVHIAQAHDGTAVKYYINGSLEETIADSNSFDPSVDVHLGGFNFEHLDGNLDDFRIYDKELSASEISDIYNATKA